MRSKKKNRIDLTSYVDKPVVLMALAKETNIYVNSVIDLILDISAKYMDFMSLHVNDMLSILNISDTEIVTESNTPREEYEKQCKDYDKQYEDELNKIKALKGDYTSLIFNPDECKGRDMSDLLISKKVLLQCAYEDIHMIVVALSKLVSGEEIQKHLQLPDLLNKFDVDITRCDSKDLDVLNLIKFIASNRQGIRSALERFNRQCQSKTNPIVDILGHEIFDVLKPVNDLMSDYEDNIENEEDNEESNKEGNEKGNNIENTENIKPKQEFKYIDDYKDLVALAKSNGYEYRRNNGDHGIFENSKGGIIVIPQGRTIGKGLSIKIQKSIL